jgi:TatD DNase family protein
MGCWFSIGPAMLAGAKGKDLVSRMPRDRIVTESDGPFANISGRALGPWDVESAVNELGNLWNVSVLEAHQQVQDNLGVLVRDPRSPWFA